MNRSSQNEFKLSKKIRLASKLIGYKSAFNMFGAKKLGEGAFGSVFSSKNAAVKVSHGSSSGQRGYDELEHEVKMLQQVQGIKVAPKLLGSGKGYAAIQKFEGKQLKDYVTKIKENPIFADYIFRKIVEALGALHRKNIAQRDLHAGNIFITNDYQVKILDYGQASKGYASTYYETFFGNNGDPSQGSVGLIMHLFDHTRSFKTYKRILTDTIKKICTQVGADPKLVLLDYEDIEGDDVKEVQYFEELSKITLHPKGDTSHVKSFYNALDTALKINTKNPSTLSNRNRVASKTPLLPTAKATKLVLNRKTGRLGIPKAKDGGVFSGPDSGYMVELHGTEAVIPLDDINVPSARYIQGQSGVWELEFDSVIDHAIYFAGKSPFPKGPKQTEILDWLQDTLKLSWKQISDHREKILDKIRELTPGAWEGGNYPYLRIPRIDPDFEINSYIQADEEDDDIPEGLDDLLGDIMMDDEEDDDIPEGLDDLLGNIRVEEENNTDKKEVDTQAEIASEVLTQAEDAREQAIDESVLDDLPESLRAALVGVINKKNGTNIGGGEQKKTSSYVSNNKIFKFLTTNLYKIQGQLDSIDRSIQDQTSIVQANLQVTSNIYENLDIQNQILGEKLDAILQAFDRQNQLAKKFADDEENRLAAQRLAGKMDAAGTETPVSTIGSAKGSSGNSLLRRLTKFFGRKLASQIFKRLPYGLKRKMVGLRKLIRLPGKLKAKVTSKITSKILQRVAPKIAIKPVQAVATRGVAKGFEHIALPGVSRTVQQVDKPAAKVIERGGENILQRALKSPAIQKALIRVLGKEGAEKLTVKIAAKLIPGISTAYGLGEGLARIAMGDVKGGFLSFGSAIPIAGYGFAAVDILRDINPDAYTKHIESNLPAPSNENFAAFFADALGVTEDQYETGGVTKPGLAMLHGTEAVVNKNAFNTQPVDPVGGNILAATTQYINKLGPIGSSIAPTFKQAASPLAKIYGMPSTLVQTNVGGSLPSLQSSMRKVREKKKLSLGEIFGSMEMDLLKTTDSESFADKLLKMIDPEGKFKELLEKINNGNNNDAPTVNGDSLYAEGGEAVTSGDIFSAYGMRGDRMHNGIDLSSAKFKQGTPISVIKPGKVVFAGWQDPNNHKAGWGQFVAIKHDDGTASLYGHLDQINVSTGQRVEPDSSGKYPVIGKLGNTGSSTGAHLHFEVGTGWTGGTLTGHMNPASVVGEYLRGGGNVKKKESTGDAPQATPQSSIMSGQDISQNYGMETGQEKEFASGNKKYKAHKTKKGFEFFDGATRIETSGGSNNKIVRDFMESQGTKFDRVDNDNPADEFMKQNGITAAPVAPQPPANPNPNTPKYQPNIIPPTKTPLAQSKYNLRQGSDSNKDTQIIMIPAASNAGQSISKNATIEGQRFTYDANHNTFNTSEVASTTRALVLRRLGLN
jgi:murein DD-endopeptidase MepM/ murein hydrolase activator NlpD/predicted Ser/Thr protein kinase